jgi:hypothetical protein
MRTIFVLAVMLASLQSSLFAQAIPMIPELPAMQESMAFKRFKQSPSELSKLFYLVERFKHLNAEIEYGSRRYKIKEISALVQGYIFAKFDRKQTARDWVVANVSYTRTKRTPIFVRLKDGTCHRAVDVLLKELEALDKTMHTL